jgi:hypothetical protein
MSELSDPPLTIPAGTQVVAGAPPQDTGRGRVGDARPAFLRRSPAAGRLTQSEGVYSRRLLIACGSLLTRLLEGSAV